MKTRNYSLHRIIALVVMVAMCCSLGITAQASGTNFVDVPSGAWYYEAVMKVVEEGLFNGTDESHFSPDGTLNRAMFVTVMWRYDGQPSGYIPQFSDVAEGSFFYDAVGWASAKGLVNGVSQDLFAPGSNIIREQMVVLMYRYAVYKGMEMDGMEDLNEYADGTQVSAYAQEAVSWALGNGLLMTRDGMICPWDNATRADAAFLWAGFLNINSDRPSDSDDQNGADGKSAYELAVENGYEGTVQEWLASLVGNDGASAYEVAVQNGYEGTEIEWLRSLAGADGLSAYEIAVKNGYKGTEVEWLASLVGENGADGQDGASAYQLAVFNGYKGSEEEWLLTLVGPTGAAGKDGRSAYELAKEQGFQGTLAQWLDSLVGADGAAGKNGQSAYELAVANGFKGSLTDWLASLVGADGQDGAAGRSAYELAVANGYKGTVQQWLASLVGAAGKDGADGRSAYELAVANGYKGTEAQWLASLAGAAGKDGKDGKDGADGKSAYELAVENGFRGTEAEWLESLKGGDGADGKDGTDGKDGEDGIDGEAGVSVVGAYINDEMHMILIMSDGSEIDAGYVGVEQKAEMVTVTFIDHDGTVLKTEVIEKGSNATAPQVAARKGYLFTGWDRDFEEVTENMEVRAQYGIARNQLYFDYQQNGDGTLTVTLTACGDVNFYGLSLEIDLSSAVGLRYNGAAALANGAIVNYKNGKILLAYTNVTGRDNEAETPLLEIIFDITGSAQKLEPAVSAVDIFDEEYRDETYHISNSSYER